MIRDKLIDLITVGIARACVKEANGETVDKAAEIADVLLEQTNAAFFTKDEKEVNEQIDSDPWNNDIYKTITFVSDEILDAETYEGFRYLARREELRELLICAYPNLVYNMAGGMESATYLANVILANDYRKSTDLAEEIFAEISKASADWGCYCISAFKWGYVTSDVSRTLAELRKKYTKEIMEEE